ncbi:bifunctional transcriptional activator/DNA repair enzyme AdaA [Actinomycetes bacterium NPDC127524]
MANINLSFEEMWEKIIACDRMYDGLFFTAVKTTKIYCRPSCRSRKPKKVNVEFYDDITEVEKAGFRACKRCQPEAEQSPHMEVVKNVITYLINGYKQNLVLKDIAAHLLKNTSLTNLDICYEAGFRSPSNFYKVFRSLKHCSPSEYRKEHMNELDGS